MISITVVLHTVPLNLLYKTKENAEGAFGALQLAIETNAPVRISDEFGQTLHTSAAPTAVVWDDLDVSKLAQIERALHQARTQAEAQTLARSDPKLRMASAGPSVLSPFGPGN